MSHSTVVPVKLGAGLNSGELFGYARLLISPPKVHRKSTSKSDIGAVLVGTGVGHMTQDTYGKSFLLTFLAMK